MPSHVVLCLISIIAHPLLLFFAHLSLVLLLYAMPKVNLRIEVSGKYGMNHHVNPGEWYKHKNMDETVILIPQAM